MKIDKAYTTKPVIAHISVLVLTKVTNAKAARALDRVTVWHHAWRVGKVKGDDKYMLNFVRITKPLEIDYKKLVKLGVRGRLTVITKYQWNKSLKPTGRQMAASIDLLELAS